MSQQARAYYETLLPGYQAVNDYPMDIFVSVPGKVIPIAVHSARHSETTIEPEAQLTTRVRSFAAEIGRLVIQRHECDDSIVVDTTLRRGSSLVKNLAGKVTTGKIHRISVDMLAPAEIPESMKKNRSEERLRLTGSTALSEFDIFFRVFGDIQTGTKHATSAYGLMLLTFLTDKRASKAEKRTVSFKTALLRYPAKYL